MALITDQLCYDVLHIYNSGLFKISLQHKKNKGIVKCLVVVG